MTDKLSTLADCAYRIRRYALRMGEVQGQGYIGQALGMADILAVAYGHALQLRPDWFRCGAVLDAPGRAAGPAAEGLEQRLLRSDPGLAAAPPGARATTYRRIDAFFRQQLALGPKPAGTKQEVD